jgi:hypothetical protein
MLVKTRGISVLGINQNRGNTYLSGHPYSALQGINQ